MKNRGVLRGLIVAIVTCPLSVAILSHLRPAQALPGPKGNCCVVSPCAVGATGPWGLWVTYSDGTKSCSADGNAGTCTVASC